MARPPDVALPGEGGYGKGLGAHHPSPSLARTRRCGDGAAFTPIRGESDANIGPPARRGILARCFNTIVDVLNSVTVQTLAYFAFVYIFQNLTESLRLKEEFQFDKFIADTFLENHFDSSHNSFESIRRNADVYEWGNNVLIPGLFANAGPCAGAVGTSGFFDSARSRGAPTDLSAARLAKGCNDDSWPDGSGSFHLLSPTAFSVQEVAEAMDVLDWTEGMAIRQVRVLPSSAEECSTEVLSGRCLPEMEANGLSDPRSFGFNWTHPSSPLDHPWVYFTSEQLGANPRGQVSASIPSFKSYETGGFVAIVLPFLSSTYLPEQRGTHLDVTDFRPYAVNRTRGAQPSPPRYFCVRLSWNGRFLHQICDPNDPVTGRRTTGVVRMAVEEFWNDLKRGHFIDRQTRALSITLPFRSNHLGVRSRVTLMIETGASGALLPSYDVETRVETEAKNAATRWWVKLAAMMCCGFVVLELFELAKVGLLAYFMDTWNLMDALNYGVFFAVWLTLTESFRIADRRADGCTSQLCVQVGYSDDWELMSVTRTAKLYLSLCVCIQLLKIIKFMKVLVPKMALATAVLYKGAMDLLFFGLVFCITLGAFSMMFYVQLGPTMEGFNDQLASFISLFRALFGDFDVPEILNNSSGYLNTVLFILYLFVAVFVMLSMFLAILGESQAAVRMDQDQKKADGTALPEYGIFSFGYEALHKAFRALASRVPWRATTHPSEPPPPSPSLVRPDGERAMRAELRAGQQGEAATPLLGLRTELRNLTLEVQAISERQRRMSSQIRQLEPNRMVAQQLSRLLAALEGGGSGRPAGGGGGPKPRGHVAMPPLLDVFLSDAPADAPPRTAGQGSSSSASGWDRARLAVRERRLPRAEGRAGEAEGTGGHGHGHGRQGSRERGEHESSREERAGTGSRRTEAERQELARAEASFGRRAKPAHGGGSGEKEKPPSMRRAPRDGGLPAGAAPPPHRPAREPRPDGATTTMQC